MDNESPDHAGLRSEARRIIRDDRCWRGHRIDVDAMAEVISQFVIDVTKTQRQMFLGLKAQNDLLTAEVEQLRGFLKIDGEVLTNEVDKNRDAILDIDRLQKDALEKDREVSQMAAQMQDVIAQRDRARNAIKAAIAFVEQIMEESGELMNPFGDIALDDLRREIGEPATAKEGE